MVKPLAERIEDIEYTVDTTDPDWGEMRDIDIAAAREAYEADLIQERIDVTVANTNTPLNAEWAVESGWMSRDNPAVVAVLGEAASYDWDMVTSQFAEDELGEARQTVTASRVGAHAMQHVS